MLLDNHPAGPLDGLWTGIAAGGGTAAMSQPWSARDRAGPASKQHRETASIVACDLQG